MSDKLDWEFSVTATESLSHLEVRCRRGEGWTPWQTIAAFADADDAAWVARRLRRGQRAEAQMEMLRGVFGGGP